MNILSESQKLQECENLVYVQTTGNKPLMTSLKYTLETRGLNLQTIRLLKTYTK